jgi:hypothetical protein
MGENSSTHTLTTTLLVLKTHTKNSKHIIWDLVLKSRRDDLESETVYSLDKHDYQNISFIKTKSLKERKKYWDNPTSRCLSHLSSHLDFLCDKCPHVLCVRGVSKPLQKSSFLQRFHQRPQPCWATQLVALRSPTQPDVVQLPGFGYGCFACPSWRRDCICWSRSLMSNHPIGRW